jgi:hypothetical protein
MPRETMSELNQLLVQHGIESVISYLVNGNYTSKSGLITMAGYKGGDDGDSFTVPLNNNESGYWYENNLSESPNGKGTGDLIELWSLIKGVSKGDACKDVRTFLNIGSGHKPKLFVVPTAPKEKLRLAKKITPLKPASAQSIDKLEKRLHANDKALSFLFARSLSELTIRHFKLGLSQPYKRTDKKDVETVQENALVVPMINKEGKYCTPNAYYNIPNLTQNPLNDNGWKAGNVNLCYNVAQKESHEWMIVAEGMKDLWALHQIISGSDLEHRIIIVSSTHGSRLPMECENPTVFGGLTRVFLGHDADEAGNEIAESWANLAGSKSYRLKPPFTVAKKGDDKDWTDFLKNGGTAKELFDLIDNAYPIRTTEMISTSNLKDIKPGKIYTYDPIDISGNYHNGHLYYPIIALQGGIEPTTGQMGYSRVVKIVRNDKKTFDFYPMPKLKVPGAIPTPIYALNDGTIISDVPRISSNATWEWNNVEDWINGHVKVRPTKDIVKDLMGIISSQIWLPDEDDYLILALVVVVTYVQTVFESVPLVLATGIAGSGKSQLGIVMSKIAANGTILSETSAATMTRVIDETRGFIVLDDVEKIASKMNASGSFNDDFLQTLKVSYNKLTAIKKLTNVKTMEVETKNFYGVKFMSNTLGIEEVLGTRTFIIHTARAPSSKFTSKALDLKLINRIKPELHAWAMENCEILHQCYVKHNRDSRPAELTAPLRAIIDLTDAPEWNDVIDTLIERMKIEKKSANTPEEVLKEAAFQIAKRGYSSFSCEHVILEMKTLVPENFMKERTNDIPEWQQVEWVRRELKNLSFIGHKELIRKRPFGKAPLSRFYKIEDELFSEMKIIHLEKFNAIKRTKDGTAFCKDTTCSDCPYESTNCYIKEATNKGFGRR